MIKSFLKAAVIYIGIAIGLALIVEFLVFQGAHPECAYNDSVGPCAFVPRVSQYVGYVAFLLSPLFSIFFITMHVKMRHTSK